MSEATSTAQPVLGAPVVPNGAAGTQTPAVVTPPAAIATPPAAPAVVDPKAPAAPAVEAAKTPEAQALEQKAADEKKAADAKAAEAKTKADADKTWADFKPKRGEGITTDETSIKEAADLARKHNLSPEVLQEFIALNDKFAIAHEAAREAAGKAAYEKAVADERKSFLEQSAKDPAYGGDIDKAARIANKAFEKFMGAERLKSLLARDPNGDAAPEWFAFAHAVGKALADDSLSGLNPGSGAGELSEQARLDALYPSMKRS